MQAICHTKLILSFNLISLFICKMPIKMALKCKTLKINDIISRINYISINLLFYRKLLSISLYTEN